MGDYIAQYCQCDFIMTQTADNVGNRQCNAQLSLDDVAVVECLP